jgi:hypothetical protein
MRILLVEDSCVALVDVNLRGGEQAYDLIDELCADLPVAPQKVVAILERVGAR